MSKMKNVAFVAGLALLFGASTASAEVRLSIQNGRVSLVAKDATVRQILAEWERIGQTKIVNLERIPGGPVTLELSDVSEQQALDVLLRSVSGYIVTPRTASVAQNVSQFDRVFVMPTSAAPRAVAAAPGPAFPQPQFQPPPTPDDDVDDDHPAPPVPAPVVPRGPVFNTFPQPGNAPYPPPSIAPGQPMQQAPQQGTPANGPYPTTPAGGVAVPGMMVPAPAQPGQPGQPGQVVVPGQPVPGQPGQPRRPGGDPDPDRR
jgi:hypothetical protein